MLFVILISLYFVPTLVAGIRNHQHRTSISLLSVSRLDPAGLGRSSGVGGNARHHPAIR